jgi:hypothetical protein
MLMSYNTTQQGEIMDEKTATKPRIATLPPGWSVKRVAADKVVVQQEMQDETATYVADTSPGVPNEIFYRLASDLADVPVVDPVHEGLVAALQAFADLDKCGDQRDALAAFDAKYGIKPGEGRYSYLYGRVHAALAAAGAA